MSSFKFGYSCLTLKDAGKVKSDYIGRFLVHDFLWVGFTLQTCRANNKQVISTFKYGYPRLTLQEGLRLNLMTLKDSQVGLTSQTSKSRNK